ncbi:LacI family transcriptional regulator [Arthrobacter sp. W1]|nr:LacI family transcriptional regulator [Arthrobacter sp. W1]
MLRDPQGTERSSQPTLKDVARVAGVHASTVSRALRHPMSEDVSESTAKIRRIAAELGYRGNFIAAGLRTNRSFTIGLVISRLTDGVIAGMCEAIERAARESGYQILLGTPPDEVGAQFQSVELLLGRKVDGLLLGSLHLDDEAMITQVRDCGVPVVAVNRHANNQIPVVAVADREGGRMATEHLIGLGHRRIGIIAGPRHASTAWDRKLGYLDALEAHGIRVDEELVAHTDFEVDGGVAGAHRLLGLSDRPSAIFAVNDTAAVGAVGAARDLGLVVPRDVSIVGYNDIPLVSQLSVPLTTVKSPSELMGAVALRQLLRLIEGEQVSSLTLPVSLVVRSSTAPPPSKH